MSNTVRKLSPSQRLNQWTDEYEKIFNHILGYVIAFTSLVAFADVLGNGRITQGLPMLFWVWVFAQGLCVEFQAFILIRRLPKLWKTNRWMFAALIGFIMCICVMSVFIGSIFVQHDNAGGSIEQAMSSLGINHTWFIFARSSLAILLIVLIAVDRSLDHQEFTEQREQTDILTSFDTNVQSMTEHVQVQMNTLVQHEQGERQQFMGHINTLLNTFQTAQQQASDVAGASLIEVFEQQTLNLQQQNEQHFVMMQQQVQQSQTDLLTQVKQEMIQTTHHVAQIMNEHTDLPKKVSMPVHSGNITTLSVHTDTKGEQVQRYMEVHPDARLEDIMLATNCAKGTASKERQRFIKERQPSHVVNQ